MTDQASFSTLVAASNEEHAHSSEHGAHDVSKPERVLSTNEALELRRREAVAWRKQGLKMNEIARRLGVSRQAVSRWLKCYAQGGDNALKQKPRSGRPTKLSVDQRKQMMDELKATTPPGIHPPSFWTATRVRRLIAERFGVLYHAHHIPRLLRQCGWPRARAAAIYGV